MVRLNRIYTRTGDDGTTGLVDGARLSKADPRMAAIGEVDELNSLLGVALLHVAEADIATLLGRVQNELFDLGADLATPGTDFTPTNAALRVTPAQVAALEAAIDRWNDPLPPLRSFVLPGGRPAAAHLHVARAACRRAERVCVAAATHHPLNPYALAYVNRLSDLLFVLCRHLNAGDDPLWVPGATRDGSDRG